MKKLRHPFNYYWKKYSEGECPFCGEHLHQVFENYDIIHCSAYGGYLVIYQDAAIAGREGLCRPCTPTDPIRDEPHFSVEYVNRSSPYREVVEGQGFLCEDCGHGVYFNEMMVFQELFKKHEEAKCKHCTWHNDRSPEKPVVKPAN